MDRAMERDWCGVLITVHITHSFSAGLENVTKLCVKMSGEILSWLTPN